MKHTTLKLITILFGLLMPAVLGLAKDIHFEDGHSPIPVKEATVQGIPRNNSIVASINGHILSIVFLENLGQVYIEVEEVGGGEAQCQSTPTPDGVDFYITYAGSYIVTFTLANGDVYYGEFEVRDE